MTNDFENIIYKPHITEKVSGLSSLNQYVFKVHLKSHKNLIKKLIEKAFKVKVSAVNTVTIIGKTRRFGKTIGKKSNWKKAYVTLKKGYVIDNIDIKTVNNASIGTSKDLFQ